MRISGEQKARPRMVFPAQGSRRERPRGQLRVAAVVLFMGLNVLRAGGLSAPRPRRGCRRGAAYFQELKIVWIRVTASSTACSLLHFSATTREMALPQTFSVYTWE